MAKNRMKRTVIEIEYETPMGRARLMHESTCPLYIVKLYLRDCLIPTIDAKETRAEAMELIREKLLP